MTVTPQTNATLEEIAEAILSCEGRIAICGHVSPDGDCIGSELALAIALRKLGRQVDTLLAKDDPLDASLKSLPQADKLKPAKRYRSRPQLFISVDVPNDERLCDASKPKQKSESTITIDHHAAPERASELAYIDPDAPATAMIVWKLVGLLGVNPDADIAQCAYTGLMTDTGAFQYQNTDAEAFKAAASMVEAGADPSLAAMEFFQRRSPASLKLEEALIGNMVFLDGGRVALSWITNEDMESTGAVKADCEPLINTLRCIDGVEVCCSLREERDRIRGSLRSKDGTDVAKIAESFGGGGHKPAAGFTLKCSLDEAKAMVIEALS